ncbi:MAG: NfeD family protein [Lachnospiraceae bacterium]|nr:NfeD family protein [Lachnospiraceae bacterium]
MVYLWLVFFILFVITCLLFQLQLIPIAIIMGTLAAIVSAITGCTFIVQLFIFALFSLASLIILLTISTCYRKNFLVDFNTPTSFFSKYATVIEECEPYHGKIYINHEIWNVTSSNKVPLHVGDKVQILSCNGNTLIVEFKE